MLTNQAWMKNAPDMHFELLQSKDEGKDVQGFAERIATIQALADNDTQKEILAGLLLDEMNSLPIGIEFKYHEPSDLLSIQRERPDSSKLWSSPMELPNEEVLYDQIYGAWLGRCVGCLLGQPIEGWMRDRIVGLLKDTKNYPVNYYISSDIRAELRTKYDVQDDAKVYGSLLRNWINNVAYMPEDDDTNYTIMGLKILETYGSTFTSNDVAEAWLENLPLLHVCTAERVAYRNLTASILPPFSASYRNVYREWIGAQIRADFFGYVTPGNPELGADMAWRDAAISHTKNGIYGEMLIAAMLSAAAVEKNLDIVIQAGLSQIPSNSRIAEQINEVIAWKYTEGIDWECALERVHKKYNEKVGHDWCHTISNALIVVISLLYGDKDLEKSIGIAIVGALDTDCNGATVGSIIGMLIGASNLPKKWTEPLCDTVKSGVDGFGIVKISDMAKRTLKIAVKTDKK